MLKRIYFILLVFSVSIFAQAPIALVRIDISKFSQKDIFQLQQFDIDIASIDQQNGRMDAMISPELAKWLHQKHVPNTPIINDVNLYAQQVRQSGYFDHFHSYPQMLEEMQAIVDEHPQLASLHDIGDSYLKLADRGGHDVWALKISDDVAIEDSTEADVLYIANLHAREVITPEVLFYFMRHLVDNYGRDALVTHLIENRELWFIPSANPDGHEYVFQGDSDNRNNRSMLEPLWWRKNMRDNNVDGVFDPLIDGVDLNRNFGFAWALDDEGSSPYRGSNTYRGPAAFSEPETQILRDFAKSKPFVISLSYHSYSNLWLYPWGYTKESLPEKDAAIFKALADSCVHYNNYNAQTGADLYLVNGDTDDWLYGECGIWAFTPEVGDADLDGFFPDTTRILPLVEENLGPNLYVAWAAGEEPIIEYKKLPENLTQQPFFDLELTITPPIVLTDSVALDSASFQVYYRPADDFLYSVASVQYVDSLHMFAAKIPGEKLFGKVYYYGEALDVLGRRGTWPRGAPMALDSFYVDYPTRIEQTISSPGKFQLLQNFPNPFNSSTTISFTTTRERWYSIDIYDISGRLVKHVANQDFESGAHSVVWNGRNNNGAEAASGFYLCRMYGGFSQQNIKLLLLR
jgi:hypothetical protein